MDEVQKPSDLNQLDSDQDFDQPKSDVGFEKKPGAKSADTENKDTKMKSFKEKLLSLWPEKRWQQILLIAGAFFLIFLSAVFVLGFYTYKQTKLLQAQASTLKVTGQQTYDQFKGQNLPQAEQSLIKTQEELEALKKIYLRLNFYSKIPFARKYYQDGLHGLKAGEHSLNAASISLRAITPYADVLGFEGEDSFTGGTAEDRIKVMLETLDKITPELDQIETELNAAQQEFDHIDPNDYPEQFRGIKVRQQLQTAKNTFNQTSSVLTDFRPVIEELPEIMGSTGERKKYIVMFQNDNELRATGGFLTAYAVIYIEDGKVTPEKSDDIYELDQKFNERIEIPDSLGRYLTTERYWNLRDMNISPDFKVSMDQFFKYYQEVPGEPDEVDGIIAVDTEVLTRLLEVLGPTEVPGYGTFSAQEDNRCDCPQVVYALSEIITKPTPYMRTDRKGILGPMMQAILGKTYAAPKEKWPELFQLTLESINGRHLQLYFLDEKAQLAAQNINAAGRLPDQVEGDFLAIIDSNLGGAKSNLFTEYEVEQYIQGPENGKLTKTVEITYKNTHAASNCNLEAGELCLNSTLPDWHRLYLPAGSELVEAQGFTQEPKQYEEQGFKVLDGFFKLQPKSAAKIKVTYTVPYNLPEYQLVIWKQGGIDPYETLIDVNGSQAKLTIDQDTSYQTEF